jgi:hypothetical protein
MASQFIFGHLVWYLNSPLMSGNVLRWRYNQHIGLWANPM